MAKYPLTLLPQIRVTHGHCQYPAAPGPVGELEYGTPAQVITYWASQRAAWVHLVDLDAIAGTGDNHLAIAAASGTHVQVAGGIRDDHTLELALHSNCSRIVLEPVDLTWVRRVISDHGSRVAVSLDVRRPDLSEVVRTLDAAGVERYVATDEPSGHRFWHHDERHLLAELCAQTHTPVTACGGVAHLEDLHRLHELVPAGLDAIVIGEPLYDGSFTYAEALAASADRFDLFFWGPPEA